MATPQERFYRDRVTAATAGASQAPSDAPDEKTSIVGRSRVISGVSLGVTTFAVRLGVAEGVGVRVMVGVEVRVDVGGGVHVWLGSVGTFRFRLTVGYRSGAAGRTTSRATGRA
jgi:hypothetical protein